MYLSIHIFVLSYEANLTRKNYTITLKLVSAYDIIQCHDGVRGHFKILNKKRNKLFYVSFLYIFLLFKLMN